MMKLKHLVLAAAMALPVAAFAIPATPYPVKVQNPDGTSMEIRLHGDEFFSYATDLNCNIILEQDAKGFWKQAVRNGNALTVNSSNLQMLREETEARQVSYGMETRSTSSIKRMADLDKHGRTTYPTISDDIHGLVVLLEYSDKSFSVADPVAKFNKMLNEEGYSDYNGVGSARDYFIATSGGKFKPTFDICPIIVKLPRTSAYYVGSEKYERFDEALVYAVEYLHEQGFDFSKYDYDNNGFIDNIFFFYCGYGSADSGDMTCIWPHNGKMSNPVRVGNLQFREFACANELMPNKPFPWLNGIGTFVHEFCHVLGLPDMYEVYTNVGTETPGNYDVMDAGPYNRDITCPPTMSGYERWLCNWIEYDYLDGDAEITLEDIQLSNKVYRISLYDWDGMDFEDEFFVIESRTGYGWDEPLADRGLAIWHVSYNKSAWVTNMVNHNGRTRYRLIRPGAEKYNGFWGGADDHLIPGDMQYFSPQDYKPYEFSPALLNITCDTENNTCSFKYTNSLEQSDARCWLARPEKEEIFRNLHMSWGGVAGATDYLVTLYKVSSRGEITYVRQTKEMAVGPEPNCIIYGLSASDWKSLLYARVRVVVDGVPSSRSSDEISFIPAELDEWTGVEEIFGDDNVPAEFFSLQGMRVDEANLLPGQVYICKKGDKTFKLIYK